MKLRNILSVFTLLIAGFYYACDVCQEQQPKITANLTHGPGPGSNWDWVAVAIIGAIVVATFIYSLKFLISPGEKSPDHIKNVILND
ncbi:MAG: hypothetical protein EAS48_08150 [Chryseobacterium sp.]|nr:MAG: hypothetical protein EAS48_08150 [Chryseobacterium sp.]